jgi:3-deoxy-D-manno-octulosonic-acid transferase
LRAYRLAAAAATPLAPLLFSYRLRRGKEIASRLDERRGLPTANRPRGPLVWLHGASVGELASVYPLIQRICAQSVNVLVTSGTVTSARLAAQRLPRGAFHQFVPLDTPRYVRRFLDYWRPELALFVESDLWPNLILELSDRGVPAILVNGRLSESSYRRWRRLPGTIAALLDRLDMVLAQTTEDARRYAELGAPHVITTGNLKLDVPAPAANSEALQSALAAIGSRPMIAATSTHAGEETAIIDAHCQLRASYPGLLTVIAPRHPDRGTGIAQIAAVVRLNAALRSRGELPRADTDIYIADTMGELGMIYRLAPIVFIGGSLVRHGGQNPIEAAKLGAAILHGPHVWNFAEIYSALDRAKGAVAVNSFDDLAPRLDDWLKDSAARQGAAEAARRTVEQLGGAQEQTLQAINPYLMQLRLGPQHAPG